MNQTSASPSVSIWPFYSSKQMTACPHTHQAPSSQYVCGVSAGPSLYIECTSETGWANSLVQTQCQQNKKYRVTESCKVSPAGTVFSLQSVS